MNTDRYLFLIVVLIGAAQSHADILELKNGTVLNGKYVGGTATTVRFDTNGSEKIFDTSQIVALTFTTKASSSTATSSVAPAPAGQVSTVTLPVGTTLLVRMMDGISSKNATGTTFTTKLEYDLVENGVVAVKGGSIVYGKVFSSTQAGRAIGKSTLDLRLSQIVVGGQPVSITTSGYQQAGQASIAKAAKGAAAGATIGAIAGDAGVGAAIGATAGALIRGKSVTIPPGTLLEFTLQSPATVKVTK